MPILDLTAATWTVRPTDNLHDVPEAVRDAGDIPATVPGCVHTDLMAAGLLEDPYSSDNELHQFWIGRTNWRYTCSFELPADFTAQHVDLACDGLDTLATLTLNGTHIGTSDNMHVAHRFDAKAALRPGSNDLVIDFLAPVPEAERLARDVYPGYPVDGGQRGTPLPHNMLRKMACNMGWDWGPTVVTSGVWRSIRLEAWDKTRIDFVRPIVRQATAERAVLDVLVDAEGERLAITARLYGHGFDQSLEFEGSSPITFTIDRPARWFPRGYGNSNLYTLDVSLPDGTTTSHRVGLRTVRIDTTPDAGPVGEPIADKMGEQMAIYVNERRVFAKGANWIPDDCFPHRVTAERYRHRIETACEVHMNLLRVWGGGLYEDDAFYETCDELGVMVWQDFLFACSTYPELEPYRSNVEREARHNVSRLCRHPSVVVWNGNNENLWFHADKPEYQKLSGQGIGWGDGYYFDLLPKIVAELDPATPYWPGSPYSGTPQRHPNANEFGNRHIWDVWHGPGEYRNYLAHYPRMATEFGYHGPPTWPTLSEAIPPEERHWHSVVMTLHNKNGRDGQVQTRHRMADDFVPPDHDFDAFCYLAQVMQARALSLGIEWFRALSPWCSGAVYWQYNDCYPVSSWSALDSKGGKKPLYHATRRFFAPRIVTIKPRRVGSTDALAVYGVNDTDDLWSGECVLKQVDVRGEPIAVHKETMTIEPRGVGRFLVPRDMHGRRDTALVASLPGGERGWWWFAPDKELDYAPPAFAYDGYEKDGHYIFAVTAGTLVRDLCVFADRLDKDVEVSDACVTLLPGETAKFRITGEAFLSVDDLARPPVLWTANSFGKSSKR